MGKGPTKLGATEAPGMHAGYLKFTSRLGLRAVGALRAFVFTALDGLSALTAEYHCGELRVGGGMASECFPLRARKDFPEEASWLTRFYLTW